MHTYPACAAESTCFNDALDPHETDVDCGGVFCAPCSSAQVGHSTALPLRTSTTHPLFITPPLPHPLPGLLGGLGLCW